MSTAEYKMQLYETSYSIINKIKIKKGLEALPESYDKK